MKKKFSFFKGLIFVMITALIFTVPVFQKVALCSPTENNIAAKTIIYYFWSKECRLCQEMKPFLEEMKIKYPGIEVQEYEVLDNDANKDLLLKMLEANNSGFSGVPVTFIGNRKFQSFNETIKTEMEKAIKECLGEGNNEENSMVNHMDIPVLGSVDITEISLPLVTVLLALVDSFNPCTFFVIFSLLGLLLQANSRKKILLIGGIFVFFTGVLYFMFIIAWLNLFLVLRHIKTITLIAGIVALFIAVINIKDFFFFKQGFSLTIPDALKPKLFQRMRKLLKSSSLPSMIMGTIILAVAANFYELLCTAGFPMIFTRILTLNDLSLAVYYFFIVLYALIYVIPLTVIVLFFTITLGKTNISERQGRLLKFISGIIMLGLGLILIINPSILQLL